ncbi:MAG: MOSC domain-containing protein [Gammaproteobacteria bacterium PRO9]|nr:MOSC domain-containing protein [Gammaproteobacteria bacterium PRO9]
MRAGISRPGVMFVRTVLNGTVAPLGSTVSGIDKHPVSGAQRVEKLGLVGDEQGDLRAHGGPDKAVHCYAWSHYPYWRDLLPGKPVLEAPGAFGENLSLEGVDECTVCIADRWRIGTALLEVSQGRQPCYKLNLRFGIRDMALRVQDTLRAGWYLRVLEPGSLGAGDRIELVDRPHGSHSIADLLALIRDREVDPAHIAPVLELPLTPSWRKLFERRLLSGQVEAWGQRIEGSST